MIYRLLVTSSLFIIIIAFASGCKGRASRKITQPPPAEVANMVKENTLTTISLTPEAESRLGIETVRAELKSIPQILSAGGVIMSPPGQDIPITAPVSGTIISSANGTFPVAGSFVVKGATLMRLIILPPEVDVISASEAVKVKQSEYDLALAEKVRAEKMYENKAISEKNFEAVKTGFLKAEASLNAAKGKADLYLGKDLDTAEEYLSLYSIESPLTGIIQNIAVTPGQSISAGTLLAEVSSDNKFWVKVSVFSGDLAKIDSQKEAEISLNGNSGEITHLYAKPINGPRRSDASNASSDIYYEIDNRDGLFRTGQKVSVLLNLETSDNCLVVPYSAIIYDMSGGTWIYEKTDPGVYYRKRVDINHISGTLAVVRRGLLDGDEVVTSGVAELYGTEFGGGK